MTLVVTIFVGMGAILLISGLEDSPLIDTFKSILGGQPVGESLQNASGKASARSAPPGGVK